MQKLTRAGVALATIGFSLLALGMGMGNVELLVLGSIPIILLATSLAAKLPADAVGSRTLSTRTPRRGESIEVELKVRPGAGSELLEVHQPVPDGFSLPRGTNLALFTGPEPVTARFEIRAHARGAHPLRPARAERIDPRGLVAPTSAEIAQGEKLQVTPRSVSAERLRRRARGQAIVLPNRIETRAGVNSNEFRELREYAWGDPPKSINWKATARRFSMKGVAQAPLVNENEREGRTSVLILLDGGADMRVGTSLETGLDHAVEGALSAARLFLARGTRVGAATFGAKAAAPAPPDAGSGQLPSLERALSPGEPDADLTPSHVLSSFEKHFSGSRPLLFVITRITPRNAPDLAEMIRRARVLARGRRGSTVFVVDVKALALAPAPALGWEAARRIAEAEDHAAAREVAQAGARVVAWRPDKEDFRAALLRRAIQ